jgi:2-polyprenyl-6-methoxyphenol hydroxylase-like FAD-dependent oxidoreductase
MALALQRRGVSVAVVEQWPELPGDGLNLPGNAVRTLGDLGLGEDLARCGVSVRRREYHNAGGRLSFAVDEAALWAGLGSRCVRRGELLQLLRGRVPLEVVSWGSQVVSVQPSSESVEVRLGGGRSENCDFVVGADGVHSTIRTGIGYWPHCDGPALARSACPSGSELAPAAMWGR